MKYKALGYQGGKKGLKDLGKFDTEAEAKEELKKFGWKTGQIDSNRPDTLDEFMDNSRVKTLNQ